jgi:predicted RND superfamily exporter protein
MRAIYKQRVAMNQIQQKNIETGSTKNFQDYCIRVPILKFPEGGFSACSRTSNSSGVEEPPRTEHPRWKAFEEWGDWPESEEWKDDKETPVTGIESVLTSLLGSDVDIDTIEQWSNDYYPDLYCGCIEATETACFEQNIIELWGDQGHYNEKSWKKIESLTEEEILDTINHKNVSGIFLKDFNFSELLGDIKYDEHGRIIGAGAVEMKFFTTVNVTAVKLFGTATRGEKVDYESFDFEGMLIDLLWNRTDFPSGLHSYVNIQRQFFDSFVGQTFKDSDKLVMGYMLVFVYVNLMLSKMNCVEQRFWLSVIGILSVAMGMILGYGICSLCGLFYSAAHTVIPFLLLGIGIDNIFVITQTFNTMESTTSPAELTKRFGQTMKHAGVAVSVTTFTDVIAFLVGSNTVLPGLQSFCVYAAAAIFAIYALQVTHFVAWFSLDQRRQLSHRDGCICCYTHKNFESYEFSKVSLLNTVFKFIGHLIIKRWFQVVVILATGVMMVFGLWGTLSLTQEYQPEWLLPPEAEIAHWFRVKTQYYPGGGEPGFVMIKEIDIPNEFEVIEDLVSKLEATEENHNIDKVTPWHRAFRDYVNKFKPENATFEDLITNKTYFKEKFTQFLFSPKGGIYQPNFWFSSKLVCGEPAPDVQLQAIPFQHKRFFRSSEWIPAMREVQQIVKDTQFSNYSFPIALTYINWETDAIVAIELIRNVSIALVCIFVTTLMTLGSWRGSIFVMMCVLFTCVNVSGFMHWWGLTIDITSMNIIIISVGLCVDFCAHIVHGFLTGTGTKDERVLYIMENIAPAVMNGGFSSMLALSLLVTSKSHIFVSFFKIFFMICLFGLFHGLILLPVVLAILGPVEEENKKDAKRKARLLEANSHVLNGTPGGNPGGHAGGSDVKYNIENRLNQETEVRESVPEEQLLASELAETVIA